MSYGFTAHNASGQVLVSSNTRNLHLREQVVLPQSLIGSHDNYGGLRCWVYRFNSPRTPVPFFQLSNTFTGVTSIKRVDGNTWEVTLIRGTTHPSPPRLFVFTDPVGLISAERFGLQVFMNDGTPAFDSRFRPLAVKYSALMAPPTEPLGPSGVSDLNPVSFNSAGYIDLPLPVIGTYSALAQCERRRTASWETSGDDGGLGKYKVNPWTQYHTGVTWAFYRSGVRLVEGRLDCGWVCVKHGYYEQVVRNSVSTLGNILTVGGEGNASSSGSSGELPYSNETLNLQPSAVVLTGMDSYT